MACLDAPNEKGATHSRHIRTFCELSADCERLPERAMTQQGLRARAYDRILKVARTVADLEDSANLQPKHSAKPSHTGALTALLGCNVAARTCKLGAGNNPYLEDPVKKLLTETK
jgi:Magnesium chelatase, subunit ChlI C-terminal